MILEIITCPLCQTECKRYCRYLEHLRLRHGALELPWTCGICYIFDSNHSPCFPTASGFMEHWKSNHVSFKTANDVVHPYFGSHYSQLPWQTLADYIKELDLGIIKKKGSTTKGKFNPDDEQ